MTLPRIALVVFLLVLAVGCRSEKVWSVEKPDPATRRLTTSGEVIGGLGRYDSHVWLGIPFAAPPVGELRWRAPRPSASWSGVREALKYAPGCPQPATEIGGMDDAPMGQPTGSEDCLWLNVFAPRFAPDQVPQGKDRLPVMFWIHGGANTVGRAAPYEGGHLATGQQVIVVTTQYRLGPMGWFRHPALRAGAADDAEKSGNFGVLDLIRGLQWVRDNAAAFGGDPGNVTIFGESAGGFDVYSLLLSPLAKGLFHRAIVQSGGLSRGTLEQAENWADQDPPGDRNSSNEVLARLLMAHRGAVDRKDARQKLAAMSEAEIAQFLRSLTPAQVLGGYHKSVIELLELPQLFKDGVVLPKGDWTERLAEPDGWNQVPVIVGSNRDETKFFLFMDPSQVKRVLGIFPRMRNESRYLADAEYQSRLWKLIAVDQPAAAMSRSGAPAVFAYRFDWDEEPRTGGAELSKIVGAAHAIELPFVFGHFDMGSRLNMLFSGETLATRHELSAAMMSYWGAFAHQGSPGRGRVKELMEWSAFDYSGSDRPKYLVFDTTAGGGLRMASRLETLDAIVGDLAADSRLPTAVDKCRLLHDLPGLGHSLSRAEYRQVAGQSCNEFPYEGYPWRELEK